MFDLILEVGEKIRDFFSTNVSIKKENVNKEYLIQYKFEHGYEKYKKMLKKLSSSLEAIDY